MAHTATKLSIVSKLGFVFDFASLWIQLSNDTDSCSITKQSIDSVFSAHSPILDAYQYVILNSVNF